MSRIVKQDLAPGAYRRTREQQLTTAIPSIRKIRNLIGKMIECMLAVPRKLQKKNERIESSRYPAMVMDSTVSSSKTPRPSEVRPVLVRGEFARRLALEKSRSHSVGLPLIECFRGEGLLQTSPK
ncbi:hypothetical protein Trydic_g3289 [Trypoxylus dichotomus]